MNSVAEGLVLDSMVENMEGAFDFTVVHKCPIYNMDTKTYHDDYCPISMCFSDTCKNI